MRLLVVNNVSSGPGDDNIYDFVRTVARPETEVVLRTLEGEAFKGKSPLQELLSDASKFDMVVAAGGDGTVSAVLYELRDSGIPILPFPSGTANILSINLDLPVTASGMADLVYQGVPTRFDLGEFTGLNSETGKTMTHGFSIVAGAGYDATVINASESMKQGLGAAAYVAGALANLTPTYADIKLEIDGTKVETGGISVFMLNFGRFQFDLKVTPGFDPQDGLFDVGVANTKMVLGLLPVIASMGLDPEGKSMGRTDALEIYKGREVHVECDPPLPVEFDGDGSPMTTPFTARVLPGAATIVIPADSPFAKN